MQCVCCRITKWQRRRTTAALAIAHTAEEADRVLLTSMYLAIGNSLNALPSQLGQLTMWRALVQVRPLCELCHSILVEDNKADFLSMHAADQA